MSKVRLGSVKLLPAAADGDVAWALDQVITRQSMTQTTAVRELNGRLASKGLGKVTRSSFNRLVVAFREKGIPQRYRPASLAAADPLRELVQLIDARIEAALEKRFPSQSAG